MELALEACREEGLNPELVLLSGCQVQPFNEGMVCKTQYTCPPRDDFIFILDIMKTAQGIILRSSILAGLATPEIKALVDRASYLGIARGKPFRRKAGEPSSSAAEPGITWPLQISFSSF